MSFWDLVSEVKSETTGAVEIAVSFDPIPDGTTALAQVVAAKWKKAFQREDEYLEIQWEVLEPASLRGRKFFAKHWIKDEDMSQLDAEKRKKKLKNAFTLFANIDFNAGGKIVSYMSSKQSWPSEDNINVALANKPMLIHVKEWEMAGNRGNWISAVWAKGAKETVEGKGAAPKASAPAKGGYDDNWGGARAQSQPMSQANAQDDDIPFAPQFL